MDSLNVVLLTVAVGLVVSAVMWSASSRITAWAVLEAFDAGRRAYEEGKSLADEQPYRSAAMGLAWCRGWLAASETALVAKLLRQPLSALCRLHLAACP